MSLLDVLTGMRNGPRGGRSGGMSPITMALLGLLAYSLHTFVREWLRRLFVDEQLTTYYAAGLLVYAATVSFVRLNWIWPQPLPAARKWRSRPICGRSPKTP